MMGVLHRRDTHHPDGRVKVFGYVVRKLYLITRGVVGVAVFSGVWYWTIQAWGLVLGLSIGWVPAGIVAVLAALSYWILCYGVFLFWWFGGSS